MVEVVKMPKMSDTMTEGVIVSWLKKEGDKVEAGDILAEVETDKATMELESYQDGTLLYIGVKEKEVALVDTIIAVIGEEGEDFKSLLLENGKPKNESMQEDHVQASEKATEVIDTSSINATIIRMPKMSDTMQEGIISSWLKKKGDKVESGDVLAEVETDKATMELESYEDGTFLYAAVEEGKGVLIDGVIAIIGADGADIETLLKAEELKISSKSKEDSFYESNMSVSQENIFAEPSKISDNGRIFASPLAKKIAKERSIDLTKVKGSGDNGRIIKRDIENYREDVIASDSSAESAFIPVTSGEEFTEKIPLSQMRKIIARRLSESKFSAPHFYLTMEVNMDEAIKARRAMNEYSPVKLSFNDLIVKAVAVALRQHPNVNVSYTGDHILKHRHIHIGVAVAIEDGLVVPVVKFADSKSISQLSSEIKRLGTKAREKKITPEEFTGNTFTVSNLGMFGIEEFTAVINPPDSCILAVGGIKETVVVKKGEMRSGNVMKMTLSCDHRSVDGVLGSAFLLTLKQLLENPVNILV